MKLILPLALCFFFCFVSFEIQAQNILYPWRATTAIVKSGNSFEIWYNAVNNEKITQIKLRSSFKTITPKYVIKKGNWIFDSTSLNTYNTKIKVIVPKNTPADRYSIMVQTNQGSATSNSGVKIINAYKDHYYLLHLSDIHAFQNGYPYTMAKLNTLIEVANIINPEIVFNTGDNLYRPNEERMQILFEGNATKNEKGLDALNAAQFTTVGNHDTDFDHVPENGFYKEKANWWNRWWGLQCHQFSYGPSNFMILNNAWVGFDPKDQIKTTVQWAKKKKRSDLWVVAAHIKDSELLDVDQHIPLNLVLVGHNHHIAHENPRLFNSKKIEYIANSLRDHESFNLYEIHNKKREIQPVGKLTAQVTFADLVPNEKNEVSYQPKIALSYAFPNNGTATSNTATLLNKLDFPIQDARVRMIMPLGHQYTVNHGKITQAFDGDAFHIVDIDLTLPPNSSITTTIQIK